MEHLEELRTVYGEEVAVAFGPNACISMNSIPVTANVIGIT